MTCNSNLKEIKTQPQNADTCAILIPGTKFFPFQPTDWIKENHIFVHNLTNILPDAHIFHFDWGGTFNHGRRYAAAVCLAHRLDTLKRDYRRILLIAHSHGGNLALQAAHMSSTLPQIVTLATPFIHARERLFVSRFAALRSISVGVAVLSVVASIASLVWMSLVWILKSIRPELAAIITLSLSIAAFIISTSAIIGPPMRGARSRRPSPILRYQGLLVSRPFKLLVLCSPRDQISSRAKDEALGVLEAIKNRAMSSLKLHKYLSSNNSQLPVTQREWRILSGASLLVIAMAVVALLPNSWLSFDGRMLLLLLITVSVAILVFEAGLLNSGSAITRLLLALPGGIISHAIYPFSIAGGVRDIFRVSHDLFWVSLKIRSYPAHTLETHKNITLEVLEHIPPVSLIRRLTRWKLMYHALYNQDEAIEKLAYWLKSSGDR